MRFLGSLGLRLAALSVAVTIGSGTVMADQWTDYRLGEVSFEAPADWKVTRRQRDRSFLLQDPRGNLELRVEWWFQDEPLLGYDHIKSHKPMTLAGKRATYVHSIFPDRQVLMAALDETRRDGRKLLLVLEGTGVRLAAMTALFDDVLTRVTFGKAATASPRPQTKAQPQPRAQPEPDAPPLAEPAGVLRDAAGGFTIGQPAGWRRGTTERDGMRIVTLASADRQAVILVAVLTATPERDVGGLVEDFETLYYDDYFLADSIESEGDIRIGPLEGRYVEMFGDVHTIEGVRPAFSQGRSWLFKSIGSDRAYVVAFIHARSASPALKASLDETVRSLWIGESAAAQPARPTVPQNAALSPQMSVVAGYFDNDCEAVSLATWKHPALAMIGKREQARLEWAMLCRNRSHPVFGVDFHYDPQGRTSDFFIPLYDDVLQASSGASFSVVALSHRVIIDVSQPRGDEISTDFREIPDLPESRAPDTGGPVTTQ